MEYKQPLISIITVVYNDVSLIEKTIISVVNQTYKNIEFIIIDGGSTDGTVDVIKKYANQINYWVSEPDKGIYDAMNKGISAAKGDWINFMNSGDWLYENSTIASVFAMSDLSGVDVVYGNTEMRKGELSVINIPGPAKRFWKKLMVHQSIFSRSEINKRYPFDTSFKVSADFDFIYKVFFFKLKTLHVDTIISSFDLVGYSHHNRYIGFSEDRKIAMKYKGNAKMSIQVYCHYIGVSTIGRTIDLLKKYTPGFYNWLKKNKD